MYDSRRLASLSESDCAFSQPTKRTRVESNTIKRKSGRETFPRHEIFLLRTLYKPNLAIAQNRSRGSSSEKNSTENKNSEVFTSTQLPDTRVFRPKRICSKFYRIIRRFDRTTKILSATRDFVWIMSFRSILRKCINKTRRIIGNVFHWFRWEEEEPSIIRHRRKIIIRRKCR